MRHVGDDRPRVVWKCSPDSEEIRQHLLNLLQSLPEQISKDFYPLGHGLGEVILRQLGEFGEKRAVENLEWVCENSRGRLHEAAKEALAKIHKMHGART